MQILIFYWFLISIFVQNTIVQFIYLFCLFFNVVLDLSSRYAVCSSHSERIRNQPVVYDSLGSCHKLVSCVRTYLQPNRMNKTSSTWSDHFLLKCTRKQFSFSDDHRRIVSISKAVFAFPHFNSDFFRNDHAHDLFTSPQRLRLEDGRNRKLSRKQLIITNTLSFLTIYPNHQIHGFLFRQEGVSHGEEINS